MNTDPSTIEELNNSSSDSPASVFKTHADWVGTAYNRFVLNPCIPEVMDRMVNIFEEVVKNYEVDGIHFDDYFYDESSNSKLNDDVTYKNMDKGLIAKRTGEEITPIF
ncbi:MAG: family 10 glycosylhydrolase [Symbiopectobacterium sp.]|uniref:family 10 glycosylhydrolase n=1 Tax=Symbiopectobacterium sp. TaxID=2952789 RepID=UPI003F2BFB92